VSAKPGRPALSAEDDAKLIFGTVFSLRNMVRKLGGDDDTYAGFLIAQMAFPATTFVHILYVTWSYS
jgi:hypothetical protein